MSQSMASHIETAPAAQMINEVARRIQTRELQGVAAAQAASQLQLDLISPNGAWSGTAGDALVRLLNSVGDSVASSALSGHTYAAIDSDCRAIFDHFDGDRNRKRSSSWP